jgi:hypothetical protein
MWLLGCLLLAIAVVGLKVKLDPCPMAHVISDISALCCGAHAGPEASLKDHQASQYTVVAEFALA